MEEIVGYVKKIIFHNKDNFYSVVNLKIDQKKDENIILVGYFKIPKPKELYRFFGEYIDNEKYGRQFKVEALEQILPNDKDSIIRFLSSSMFKGVGSATATKIIEVLGVDCLDKIRQDKTVLDEVNIKEELKEEIFNVLSENSLLEETIKLFAGSGLGMKYLIKMDSIYGKDLANVIHSDPYIIARTIDGISFKSIDYIASKLGIEEDDPRRVKALLIYYTKDLCFSLKNNYTSKDELFKRILRDYPTFDYELLENMYRNLLENFDLIDDDYKLYYKDMYDAEIGIARYLKPYIFRRGNIDYKIIDKHIETIQKEEGIRYSDEQINAIHTCLNSGVSIITGGPGTGKTTVVKAIINIYGRLFNEPVVTMLAPTGRASKRLAELSSYEASTIHRFLKWDLDTCKFAIDDKNPRLGHFYIVDEFSMVDSILFYHLLQGTYPYVKILIIGDEDQLPPVSPGNVLKDLLDLKMIPTTRLISNFRQDSNSGIIPLCQNIVNGVIDEENLNKDDVSFIYADNDTIRDQILHIVEDLVSNGYSSKEIQVLSPMYDGPAGIYSLNEALQDFFNPKDSFKKEVMLGRHIYRVGDKILQLKNQADDDVFNGDIGYLVDIIESNNKIKFIINFDGNEVSYSGQDLFNISLAYCISVHKSQGSEYDYVIMPFIRQHSIMLKRKLIYTGISRAKKKVFLLGDKRYLRDGVKKVEIDNRKTYLKERIKQQILDQ